MNAEKKNQVMTEMTDEEFNSYFAYSEDVPDVAEKAKAIFEAQPDLPYVEIDGYVVPNRKLLEEDEDE